MNLQTHDDQQKEHYSQGSTTWDFLEATSPSYAVISCGINNQYNHPSADTMGRLSDMGIPVFRTYKQGTIIAVSDGTNISWSQEPCNDYSSYICIVGFFLFRYRIRSGSFFLPGVSTSATCRSIYRGVSGRIIKYARLIMVLVPSRASQ